MALAGCALVVPATGRAATVPVAGSTSATAIPLVAGQDTPHTLRPAGAQDWFRFDVAQSISFIRLSLTNASSSCEVWATLVDSTGAGLGSAVIDPHATGVVLGLAPTAGAYFIRIDGGPYVTCRQAAYRLTAAHADLSPTGQTTATAATATSVGAIPQACQAESARLDVIGEQIARTRALLRKAHGVRRRLLERRMSVQRSNRRGTERLANRYC